MSVLVTGASGLVGSHVVEALVARGDAVRALVRPASRAAVLRLGADAVVGDVTDPAAWRAAARGVRAIVHAAAIVQRRASWEQYVAVNVEATRLAVAARTAPSNRSRRPTSTPAASVWPRTWCGTRRPSATST